MSENTRVAVIGAGHWGPNLIRSVHENQQATLVAACDLDEGRLERVKRRHPSIDLTTDASAVLHRDDVDAVVIATPPTTHFELTAAALKAGKHVLVEKPLTPTSAEGAELIALAEEHDRTMMVGNVFLFNGGVRAMKSLMEDEEFGKLKYIYSRRTNLGPVRDDCHAGWDLAAHDVAIFMYLKGETPTEVTASGQSFIREGVPDVVFANLFFADGTLAHVHTSWLDPQKVREVVAVGDERMIRFDDMNVMEPVRVYHKGFRTLPEAAPKDDFVDSLTRFRVELIKGEVYIPAVSTGQPLQTEVNAFIDAVRSGDRSPLSDAKFSNDAVRVLEAMDRSLEQGSKRVSV